MPEVVKKFVLGKEAIPEWFNELCNSGRCRVIYDEDEMVGVNLYTPSGIKKVKLGDIIVLSKSGVFSLTQLQARTYGVQGNVKKENS